MVANKGTTMNFVAEVNRRWEEEIATRVDWPRLDSRLSLRMRSVTWRSLLRRAPDIFQYGDTGAFAAENIPRLWLDQAPWIPPLSVGDARLALGAGWWSFVNAENWTVEPEARAIDPLWCYGGAAPQWAHRIEVIRANLLVEIIRGILDEVRDENIRLSGLPRKGGHVGNLKEITYSQFETREWKIHRRDQIEFWDIDGSKSIYQNITLSLPSIYSDDIERARKWLSEDFLHNPNDKYRDRISRCVKAGHQQRDAQEAIKLIENRRKRGRPADTDK
jgi:hypothetical protein